MARLSLWTSSGEPGWMAVWLLSSAAMALVRPVGDLPCMILMLPVLRPRLLSAPRHLTSVGLRCSVPHRCVEGDAI